MSFEMYVPTRILFGRGELDNLNKQKMPGKKAMIVISNGVSARKNGSLQRTEKQLKALNVKFELFDKVEPNPLKSTVEAGAKFARDNGCDFIIALGGGSVMDASKAMAAVASNGGETWDYIYGGTGKGKPIVEDPLPIIAITTTAGTGSEVDPWGVITNDETKEKIGFGGDERLFPQIAIVDPELMKSVPAKFTAYQGFDALFHSVECYISKFANIMSDMYALTAIENIARYLPAAVKDGNDMRAREMVAFANTLSGIVMTISSTTAHHSMEHAMSAYHQDLPHGAGLIMISAQYYKYYVEKHVCDERFVKMAQVMGLETTDPADFIRALEKLQKDCGVDNLKMSDYAITKDEFEILAKNARETMGGLFSANPCELSDKDCAAIFAKSYK